MKAIQYNEFGGTEVLKTVEVDAPHAGTGQIRISVKAAGVNPADWKRFKGYFKDFMPIEFPAGLGFEAAGIVDEIGEGVTGVKIGDAVFGLGVNTLAEQAVLTSWAVKPDNMPFEIAGGLAVVSETGLRCLEEVGAKAGQTLLVSGAAGGVGSAIIQFARHRQITVIGTASAPKHDYLQDLGAIPTTYGSGLAERVKGLAPQGVDVAIDLAGAGNIPELIAITGNAASVVSACDFSAPQHGAKFTTQQMASPARALSEAAQLYSEGKFSLHLEKVFSFAQAGDAYDLSAEGHVTGKLVISMP